MCAGLTFHIQVVSGKEAEALAVVSVTKEKYPQDLPPAYEDVANLTVQLEPVHQSAGVAEAKKLQPLA